MKRRNFIKFSLLTTLLFSQKIAIAKTFSNENLQILDEVLNIIFPKTATMPSAKEFKALNYLVENISQKSFDDEDKNLIIKGTQDFKEAFPEFLSLKENQKKELIFSIILKNDYAKSWISKLSYYGVEAMFSDPIYGGNFEQIGWKSVNHNIGYPRPLKTYGQKI